MSSASFASDWNLPRSQLLSLNVFPVQFSRCVAERFGSAMWNWEWRMGMNCSGNLSSYASSSLFRGFACANPQNDTVETIFSQYINWSYGLLHFRFACLPCYLIPWLGSGSLAFHSTFPIPNSTFSGIDLRSLSFALALLFAP